MTKAIRTLVAFIMLARLIWVLSAHLLTTDAATKALTAEANLASLANDVANLRAGIFDHGIKMSGDLYMNGHNIFMGSTSTVTDAGGGDYHTNGGSLIDRTPTTLAFP